MSDLRLLFWIDQSYHIFYLILIVLFLAELSYLSLRVMERNVR